MKSVIIMLAVLMVLTGCSQKEPNKPTLETLDDVELKVTKEGNVDLHKTYTLKDGNTTEEVEAITQNRDKQDDKAYEIIPSFDKNYDRNLALKNKSIKKEERIVLNGEKVKISVEAIPVNEFIDLVFSSLLKLNYTVPAEVSALTTPITLNMTQLQPKQEVFDVVTKLLSLNGIALKKQDGVIFLSKKDTTNIDEERTDVYIGYGRKVSAYVKDDQHILMFVPYNYIDGSNAVTVLRQAGISKVKFYYTINGMQMMDGTASDIRQALSIVDLIDRPYLDGKTLYLVELKEVDATEFVASITKILAANSIQVSNTPTKGGILISPITELNSILVISPNKSWMDMILYWKEKLDVVSQASPSPKFYTYKVKNRKADELAEALNDVVEIKLSSSSKKKEEKTTTEDKNVKNKETKIEKIDHSIKFDLQTNTLMMQLLPSEYRELLPLIEELDALPKQVLVEVTFAEVTLTDTFNLGFEYALRNDAAAGLSPIVTPLATAAFGGSGFAATYNSKNLDATINAYAENKLLSIMSKPKLLILNNQTGNINVGTQIPIITSESSATDIGSAVTPSILRNVTYRNTGVVVGIMPTINSNGILTMNVTLQLSEAQLNDTSSIDSPLIVNRSLSTSLTIENGQSVLLGGLISKNKSTTDSGVPILMDIPWLGTLFQSTSEKVVKTELIMLIKPYIIETPIEMSTHTKKYESILKLLKEYSFF